MALLQGWPGRVGRKKLRHIWKKNKSLRLLFMTEWKPLVIAKTSHNCCNGRKMSINDVLQPCAFRSKPKLKRAAVTSSSPNMLESHEKSFHQNNTISNRPYADLGHEVDSGKGIKTVVLGRETSWIDYCSACGALDALEYYHVAGCYKLCSQNCFRDYIQRRKYIFNCTRNTLFSRKSQQALEISEKEVTQSTTSKESGNFMVSKALHDKNFDMGIVEGRHKAKESNCDSKVAGCNQTGDTVKVKKTKLKKSRFSIPLRIAFKPPKHHKKKYVNISPTKCRGHERQIDTQSKMSPDRLDQARLKITFGTKQK